MEAGDKWWSWFGLLAGKFKERAWLRWILQNWNDLVISYIGGAGAAFLWIVFWSIFFEPNSFTAKGLTFRAGDWVGFLMALGWATIQAAVIPIGLLAALLSPVLVLVFVVGGSLWLLGLFLGSVALVGFGPFVVLFGGRALFVRKLARWFGEADKREAEERGVMAALGMGDAPERSLDGKARLMDFDEFKRFKYSLIIPSFFVFVLWVIKVVDEIEHLNLFLFGVFPRETKGILGIFFSPMIHSDFNHLISNSIPLLVLGTGVIYFYRELAYKVFTIVWLLSGVCVWIGARDSYHIGASGLIYGFAAFLFLSGIIRKDFRLAAISLLVVFLYGSLIWGVFPIFPNISWEYHLWGAVSGFIAAIIYRKHGPQRIIWSWENEEEDGEEVSDELLEDKTVE